MKHKTTKHPNDTPPGNAGEPKYHDLDPGDRSLVDRMANRIARQGSSYSRREVLRIMTATGVGATTAGALLLAGCEQRDKNPKGGGSVIFSSHLHGPDDQLDPMLATATIDYTRMRVLYNSLTQIDEHLTPQPELAESFDSNSDATEWTFKIRQGVTFHDGSKMTADDVVYSMNRHIADDSTSTIKAVLASVSEWKKTGPYEVKAIMNTPNADLPILCGLFQSKIVKNGTNGGGIGTGPFTMESFEPGVKSVHTRNQNYWREGARLEAVEITAITDSVARVNALLSGDVQMITNVDPKSFRQVEEAEGVKLFSVESARQLGICCLKSTEPGSSDDFVKGMQYIQDRERIVSKILKGGGSLGNDSPIASAHGRDFCHELPQRAFDPDKAKYHFERSGYSSAELFVAPVAAGIEEMCLLAQTNCAKIGFDLRIKRVPTDGYWGAVWLSEPLNVVTWLMRPTANAQMAIQFAPDAAWNDSHWKNDRMGDLLKLSLAETDADKRHALYCEMQTLIHNNSGMVIPAFSNFNEGLAENIRGVPRVPLGDMGGAEWPEFVWLADDRA